MDSLEHRNPPQKSISSKPGRKPKDSEKHAFSLLLLLLLSLSSLLFLDTIQVIDQELPAACESSVETTVGVL